MRAIIISLALLTAACEAEAGYDEVTFHYEYSPFVDMYRGCRAEKKKDDIHCQCLHMNVESEIEGKDASDMSPVEREAIIRYAALDCIGNGA